MHLSICPKYEQAKSLCLITCCILQLKKTMPIPYLWAALFTKEISQYFLQGLNFMGSKDVSSRDNCCLAKFGARFCLSLWQRLLYQRAVASAGDRRIFPFGKHSVIDPICISSCTLYVCYSTAPVQNEPIAFPPCNFSLNPDGI